MRSPLTRMVRFAAWCAARLREQAAHETQAELNRQLAALHRPHGAVRPSHICAPAFATLGAGRRNDPLEQLWRLPARRVRGR